LLAVEAGLGILGPALKSYRGHSAALNRAAWARWDWRQGGEEWTQSEEWKGSVVDDLLGPIMPEGGTILEIGPGAGRWTEFLLGRADRLILVDVTERALELCRERFGKAGQVQYVLSSGGDLPGVADRSVDGIWSFDVFVHVAPSDIASYLSEIGRVLRPGAVALIHHSGRPRPDRSGREGWRSPMSARLFAGLARRRDLTVERQFQRWGRGFDVAHYGDLITVLRAR
jgi:ubiquinone/menaquinone biosynthesis C-methylase UbiE